MKRQILKHVGLLAIVAGSLMLAVPALAYTDTTPGAGATTSSSTVTPGQPFTLTATFPELAAGTAITFSSNQSGACTVTFNPTTATLDANHQASTQVTVSADCAGANLALIATGPQGQTVTAVVAVAGGFPNTSTSPVPLGWLVMAFGALLIALGIAGVARRRPQVSAAA